ncbi:MAG: hypothetical protein CMG66_05025 [Candidatus Marinimicrobia bacterium]|nr:hypothetical protein [Candidatus Neomarinimicrobiota bacterium]|tara:strand:+ start:2066 stop:3343 length:1278 start_codon:yes stop_codon:yes gene_type:complete
MKYKILILFTTFTLVLSLGLCDYPEHNITINESPFNSKLFIHSMSGEQSHIGIMNPDLSLYWHVNSGQQGFDFRNNNQNLTYYDKIYKHWIVANNAMQEVDTLQCLNGITDYHDIRLLDDGGYILQCYDSTWVDLGSSMPQLIRDILVIQEFDRDNNLILNWNALNHLSLHDYPNINLNNPQITFMHGNSIEIDFDNNLLISNRTSNEIFKLDRTTGEIIWIMGGPLNEFTFIDDPLGGFNKQHDVRRIFNGNITLFDNGTQHQPMLSRAVEYQIDEDDKTARLVWEYTHPDSIVAMSMGSVQRLPNNNTLINWGFFFETNILNIGSYIMEVDYDKNIVFELTYPPGYYTYRATKNDWDFNINLIKGDSNLDNTVDIIDIIFLINYILYDNSENSSLFEKHKLDVNTDSFMNIVDAVELINIILD